MAQNPAQFCPECGTPVQAGQRFCSNCGATVGAGAAAPTAAASYIPPATGQSIGSGANEPTIPDTDPSVPPDQGLYRGSSQSIAPPPPPTAYNPYESSPPAGPQTYEQNASIAPGYVPPATGGTYAPVPAYAQAPQRSRGCLVTSLILLLVLAAGIGGYILVSGLLNKNSSRSNNPPTTSTSSTNTGSTSGNTSGSSAGSTPTAAVSSSEQLNLKLTYASINITIVSAQEAKSFSDDNSTPGSAGMVRVNVQEDNPTTGNPIYSESTATLLVLPDGSTVKSGAQQQYISPDGGVNRPNWLDFPINNPVNLNQLTLRFGTASETQMDIPLQPHADLSKYQDKTSSPNAQFTYAGINWTLKTATLSYSYADKQATAGNRYVIVTLSAVNNTSNSYIDNASSYMRMQAGGNTVEPDNTTTLTNSIAGNSTASGVVAFLVPQSATSFTLVMLAQPGSSPAINQVTQTFQIQ